MLGLTYDQLQTIYTWSEKICHKDLEKTWFQTHHCPQSTVSFKFKAILDVAPMHPIKALTAECANSIFEQMLIIHKGHRGFLKHLNFN